MKLLHFYKYGSSTQNKKKCVVIIYFINLVLDPKSSTDWVTTISFFNNLDDKYIHIWFVKAPEEYNFIAYNVSLMKIVSSEDTVHEKEERETVEKTGISEVN